MKDIHNHLLFNIDDGSTSIDKSIEILNLLKQRGVTDIVATPHYIIGTNYNSNNEEKLKILNELRKHTDINLYLGNEVYIDKDIIEYIKNDEISTINGSRYLLMELPLNEKLDISKEIIFNLRKIGIIPVIAHPERYSYMSINDLEYLIDQGCLFQGNITALSNKYGRNVKKNLELLIKKHMIHVLGTDTHLHVADLEKCYKRLKKLVDNDMYNDLLCNNFDKIINNKDIDAYEIVNTGSIFKKEKMK